LSRIVSTSMLGGASVIGDLPPAAIPCSGRPDEQRSRRPCPGLMYASGMAALYSIVAIAALGSCAAPAVTGPVPTAHRAAPTWNELARQANEALAAKDFVRYRARLVDLYRGSRSSSILLGLARADARVGDVDAAFAHLDEYAALGLDADLSASPALKDDPRWPALRARLEANRAPVAHATTAFALPRESLVAEGLAWDPRSRVVLVSSVRQRKILAVDEHGTARDFVPASQGIGALCGIASDAERLWVTMATMPPMSGFDPQAPRATALLAYDLANASLRGRFDLPVDDGREHALTDLAVGPRGDVYVSDEAAGMVYTLAPGAIRLEPVVPADAFLSPQTPAVTLDGRRLYIPDYVRGIAMLDLTTRALTWITPEAGVALDGIDDLHVVGDDLLAIQNGVTPPRIVRIMLDASGIRATRVVVLERASPGLGDPTHGFVRDGRFYFIAAAGWKRFNADGTPHKDAPPDAPLVMVLPLRDAA
jgi:hypothetical protein